MRKSLTFYFFEQQDKGGMAGGKLNAYGPLYPIPKGKLHFSLKVSKNTLTSPFPLVLKTTLTSHMLQTNIHEPPLPLK